MPGADPTEYAIRLGLWLAARQQNPHPDNTTLVARDPLDRSTSAYMIAESDVAAVLDENARMREERAADQSIAGRVGAYKLGWMDCRAAILSATANRLDENAESYVRHLREERDDPGEKPDWNARLVRASRQPARDTADGAE